MSKSKIISLNQWMLNEIGRTYAERLKLNLKKDRSYASGSLEKSISYRIDGSKLIIESAEHLWWVSKGRKKGKMPPVSNIKKWVSTKNIQIKGRTQEQTAWIISKSIAKKGTKGTNVIERTKSEVLTNNPQINEIVKQMGNDFIKTLKLTF